MAHHVTLSLILILQALCSSIICASAFSISPPSFIEYQLTQALKNATVHIQRVHGLPASLLSLQPSAPSPSTEFYEVKVTGTETILAVIYHPNSPIDPDQRKSLLQQGAVHFSQHYDAFGDGPLQSIDDPYRARFAPRTGISVWLQSDENFKLTYKVAMNTFVGMMKFYSLGPGFSGRASAGILDRSISGTRDKDTPVGLLVLIDAPAFS